MDPISDVASHVLEVLRSYKEPSISGSQLASVVRFKFPDFQPFDFGCVNLRDFLRKHVPSVRETGKVGGDFLYSVVEQGQATAVDSMPITTIPQTTTPGPQTPFDQVQQERAPVESGGQPVIGSELPQVDSAVWKTFASPAGLHKIYAHPQSGQFVVVPPGTVAPDAPWRQIHSCSAETHVKIATDFVSKVPDAVQQKALAYWIGKPGWWFPFYKMIQQFGLAAAWNPFRRQRILSELRTALQAAGIPINVRAPQQFKQPLRYDEAKNDSTAGPSSTRRVGWRPRAATTSDRIRRIASAAVGLMSESELRALRLPLGKVIDALDGLA